MQTFTVTLLHGWKQQWPPEVVRFIQQLEQRIKQLENEYKDLKKRITELENKLKAYQNPHKPPSMQRFKGSTSGTNPSGKRGAPLGHYGATRERPEPGEIIPMTMDQCPRCGSYLGNSIGIESRTIEDSHHHRTSRSPGTISTSTSALGVAARSLRFTRIAHGWVISASDL